MRKFDGFFYGLYMDEDVLKEKGIIAQSRRLASVDDFALRIGRRATLIPSPGSTAYGILQRLSHHDLDILYGSEGLEDYRPEAISVVDADGLVVPALCYNLINQPEASEKNADYAAALKVALSRLGFPPDYISTVG